MIHCTMKEEVQRDVMNEKYHKLLYLCRLFDLVAKLTRVKVCHVLKTSAKYLNYVFLCFFTNFHKIDQSIY
jgi:hypothetical protein